MIPTVQEGDREEGKHTMEAQSFNGLLTRYVTPDKLFSHLIDFLK